MAVAHDAQSQGGQNATTHQWTHTPVGTPRGATVIIAGQGSSDAVTGVTYGGVAMARERRVVKTATESGQVWLYFLGSGLGTGAKTVQVSLSGGTTVRAVCSTVTASADTEVDVSNDGSSDSLDDPSLTLATTTGRTTAIYYGLFSGLNAPETTVQSGSTHQFTNDFGTQSAMWARKTHTGGSTTIGYTTSAAEDVVHAGLAIGEIVSGTAFEAFPADTLSLADAESDIQGFGLAVSPGDTLTLADAESDIQGFGLAVSPGDTSTLSDSPTTVTGRGTNPADSAALADTPSTLSDFQRAPGDPMSLSDAAALVEAFSKTPADLADLNDIIAAIQSGMASLPADSLVVDDTGTPAQGAGVSPADTTTLADAPALATEVARAAGDTLSLVDAATIAAAFATAPSDALSLADASSLMRDLARVLPDGATLNDVIANIQAGWAREPGDTASLADSAAQDTAAPDIVEVDDVASVSDVAGETVDFSVTPVGLPEDFYDDFENGTLDFPWESSGTVEETDGYVALGGVSAGSGSIQTPQGAVFGALTTVAIEVEPVVPGFGTYMEFREGAPDWLDFGSVFVALEIYDGSINCYVDGFVVIASAPYDPDDHRWVRLRQDGGGNVHWEASPDGDSWTTITSDLRDIGPGGVQLYDSSGGHVLNFRWESAIQTTGDALLAADASSSAREIAMETPGPAIDFHDDFENGTVDLPWHIRAGTTNVSEQDGYMLVGSDAAGGDGWVLTTTNAGAPPQEERFVLTTLTVEVVYPETGPYAEWQIRADDGLWYGWFWDATGMYVSKPFTNEFVDYDPVAHRFLRLDYDGETLSWLTSPDGVTWTEQSTEPVTTATAITGFYGENGADLRVYDFRWEDAVQSTGDSLAAQDSANAERGFETNLDDLAPAVDDIFTERTVIMLLEEDVSALDAMETASEITASLTDSISVEDATVVARAVAQAFDDSTGVVDASQLVLGLHQIASDSMVLADEAEQVSAHRRSSADLLVIVEAVEGAADRYYLVSDAVSLADAANPEELEPPYNRPPSNGLVMAIVSDGRVEVMDQSGIVASVLTGTVVDAEARGVVRMPVEEGLPEEEVRGGE